MTIIHTGPTYRAICHHADCGWCSMRCDAAQSAKDFLTEHSASRHSGHVAGRVEEA